MVFRAFITPIPVDPFNGSTRSTGKNCAIDGYIQIIYLRFKYSKIWRLLGKVGVDSSQNFISVLHNVIIFIEESNRPITETWIKPMNYESEDNNYEKAREIYDPQRVSGVNRAPKNPQC